MPKTPDAASPSTEVQDLEHAPPNPGLEHWRLQRSILWSSSPTGLLAARIVRCTQVRRPSPAPQALNPLTTVSDPTQPRPNSPQRGSTLASPHSAQSLHCPPKRWPGWMFSRAPRGRSPQVLPLHLRLRHGSSKYRRTRNVHACSLAGCDDRAG